MLKTLQIITKLKPVTTFVTRSSKKASHTSSLRRCFDIATWTRIKWSSNETDCASRPHLSLKKSLSEADLMLGVWHLSNTASLSWHPWLGTIGETMEWFQWIVVFYMGGLTETNVKAAVRHSGQYLECSRGDCQMLGDSEVNWSSIRIYSYLRKPCDMLFARWNGRLISQNQWRWRQPSESNSVKGKGWTSLSQLLILTAQQ